jgi:hypothetical protein
MTPEIRERLATATEDAEELYLDRRSNSRERLDVFIQRASIIKPRGE